MSGLFTRTANQALRLITQYGEQCTWKSAAAPVVADDTKPWITTNGVPTVTQGVPLLFTSSKENPLLKLVAGSDVEEGKLKALMPAMGFTPNLADTILRSDGVTTLALDSVSPLAPNGTPIIWYLVFKQ